MDTVFTVTQTVNDMTMKHTSQDNTKTFSLVAKEHVKYSMIKKTTQTNQKILLLKKKYYNKILPN